MRSSHLTDNSGDHQLEGIDGDRLNHKGLILAIDGDNTLWDTNTIFEEAQNRLLVLLRTADPSSMPQLAIEQLQELDRTLIRKTGRQEYDFRLLVLALIRIRSGMTARQAVRSALSELRQRRRTADVRLATEIAQEFRLGLYRIPPLLPSVKQSLDELVRLKARYKGRLVLVLLSEGDETRIRPIVQHHFGERRVFDVLKIVERKSEDTLRDAQTQGAKALESESGCSQTQYQLVVIGDSIDSDITPGNLVGAVTMYIPGAYKGVEMIKSNEQRPDRTLSGFHEVPGLVGDMMASNNELES